MDYQTKTIPIDKLKVNEGQINGLPKNPRFIKDDRFRALVKSIREAPEMLNLRELIVVEHDGEYIVIGGNMRLRASQELGLKELPCKILPSNTPSDKLREYTIKDNNGFGENDWDLLANEWDVEELEDWGTELPEDWGNPPTSQEVEEDDFDEDNDEIPKRVKEGDVWQLGVHLLICGDSTKEQTFSKLMGG